MSSSHPPCTISARTEPPFKMMAAETSLPSVVDPLALVSPAYDKSALASSSPAPAPKSTQGRGRRAQRMKALHGVKIATAKFLPAKKKKGAIGEPPIPPSNVKPRSSGEVQPHACSESLETEVAKPHLPLKSVDPNKLMEWVRLSRVKILDSEVKKIVQIFHSMGERRSSLSSV